MKRIVYKGRAEGIFLPDRFRDFMKSLDADEVVNTGSDCILRVYHISEYGISVKYELSKPQFPVEIDSYDAAIEDFGDEVGLYNFEKLIDERARREGIGHK